MQWGNVKRADCSRRELIIQSGLTGLSLTGLSLMDGRNGPSACAAEREREIAVPRGKAESCIFIWLGGGACHVDTWDPKRKGDGRKQAGSYYDPIPTAIPGVSVCEHLSRTAPLMDRAVLIRSIQHELQDHQAATNRMHTGRPTSGTIVYPSIGSVVCHQLGRRAEGVPPYIVMGYPNITRGPGFLGAKHSYIYLTETEAGPSAFKRPAVVSPDRQSRREALLAKVRSQYLNRHPRDQVLEDYAAVSVEGFRLAGPKFMGVFDLDAESSTLRNSYGGEFGQRCLLSRRLLQAGVRFVEVSFNLNFLNGTGWDTHNEGQLNQHKLIRSLDQGLASLLVDLERHKMLDSTLVVVATEFGRPPDFDAGGGRGHHPTAFSVCLAGGGLRTGQVIGETDELGRKIVQRPVSVPDLHASIYQALGVNYAKELYDGSRPVPITDQGQPIAELLA